MTEGFGTHADDRDMLRCFAHATSSAGAFAAMRTATLRMVEAMIQDPEMRATPGIEPAVLDRWLPLVRAELARRDD